MSNHYMGERAIVGREFLECDYDKYRLQLTTTGEHTPSLLLCKVNIQDGQEVFDTVMELDMTDIFEQVFTYYVNWKKKDEELGE